MENKILIPLILMFAFGSMIGCSENETAFPSMDSTGTAETETDLTIGLPTSVDSLADVALNSVLFVKLGAIAETVKVEDDPATEVKSSLLSPVLAAPEGTVTKCEIPIDDSGVASSSTIHCLYQVPELTLYYSHLKFIVGTNRPKFCPFVDFQPYSYRRSSALLDEDTPGSGYFDPGAEEYVNCGGPLKEQAPACFGGAAETMLSLLGIDFPGNSGTYFLSSNTARLNYYYLLSENKVRKYGSGRKANLLASNFHMPIVNPGAYGDARDQVVYNTELNSVYSFRCLDVFYETKFTINVFIQSSPGPLNHVLRWNQ